MEMKILLIVVLYAASAAAQRCPGLFFNNKYYYTEVLKSGLNNVRDMVYSQKDNSIYFIFNQGGTIPMGALGYFNIDNNQAGFYSGIRNATSVTIDRMKNRIYVGSVDGLYSITIGNLPEKFPIFEPIQSLYFKDILYFTNIRKQVYKFDSDGVREVPELKYDYVDDLVVDDNNNIIFLKGKKLFRAKLGAGAPVFELAKQPIDAISSDVDHKIYVASKNGVYLYNKYKYALDKISEITGIKAMTFNTKLEPIYVSYDSLIKLKNPMECVEDSYFL